MKPRLDRKITARQRVRPADVCQDRIARLRRRIDVGLLEAGLGPRREQLLEARGFVRALNHILMWRPDRVPVREAVAEGCDRLGALLADLPENQ